MTRAHTAIDPTLTPLRSLPQLSLAGGRGQVLAYFDNTWALTELLFDGVHSEAALYRRPYHKLRHPLIFYYAHPAVLYVNKLRVAGILDRPVRADFELLFEAGVDEMRWDDLHEGHEVWPPLAEVKAYRSEVYSRVRELIENHPLLTGPSLPIPMDSPLWALAMAFEHERIHLETSSVLIRELPIELVRPPVGWPPLAEVTRGAAPVPRPGVDYAENTEIEVPATDVQLGKPESHPTFGWDNEYGSATRRVAPFSASRQLISNGEFHAFVIAGGYREERYWTPEGWAWREFRNARWPTFWVPDGPAGLHQFKLRVTFQVIDQQWSWPVCVNYHEAKAYAAWRSERDGKSLRLLTEAEHHALRDGVEREWNLDLQLGSERPVHAPPANGKGFHDVFGNLWQWCEDTFHPLPGFRPHPYYDDFSTPCFDGEHQMILGGSFISTGDEASRFARFHFRPHFFQNVGFRLVSGETRNARKAPPLKRQMPYQVASFDSNDPLYSEVLSVRNAVLKRPEFVGVNEDVLRADMDSVHFLALLNDKPIGCVTLRIESGRGILRQMAVLPELRRYGIGRNLVEALEADALANGLTDVRLEARATARGFYARLGYRTTGDVYPLGGLDHQWMHKAIR